MNEFEIEQQNACKFIRNMINKNRLSHAYIIEANEYNKKNEFALEFAKILSDNSLDIEIIKPDGMWIKKEQIENLQKSFTTMSIVGNNKIYIIEQADKLNVNSSNTLLKFLEDPEENIAAILIVDNLYQVLPTIKSRCQIITLTNHEINDSIDSSFDYVEDYIKFIDNIEKRKKDIILYENIMFLKEYKNKDNVLDFINLSIDFYKAILDYKLGRIIKQFNNYENIIINISNTNTINNICNKINIFNEKKEHLKYNENINLLIDDIIIKLSEV